jgi:hypothetical protein
MEDRIRAMMPSLVADATALAIGPKGILVLVAILLRGFDRAITQELLSGPPADGAYPQNPAPGNEKRESGDHQHDNQDNDNEEQHREPNRHWWFRNHSVRGERDYVDS